MVENEDKYREILELAWAAAIATPRAPARSVASKQKRKKASRVSAASRGMPRAVERCEMGRKLFVRIVHLNIDSLWYDDELPER